MSINAALNAAMTGLTATSRAAEVVSSNIANSMNDGYGRRELALSSRAVGTSASGVQVDGVLRLVDQALLSDRRSANAAMGDAETRAQALSRIEAAMGIPGEPGALAAFIAEFEASLIEAASRPDSVIRLDNVLRAAQDLAGGINALSREVQEIRSTAERDIGAGVDRLNTALVLVHDLNKQIQRQITTGHSPNGLVDQRQKIIDDIADLVPLREVARPNGQVALYTDGGAVLLDGLPAKIGFSGSPAVTDEMTLANGALSGLTFNDRPIGTAPGGQLGGGRLAALFAVRDQIGPEAQIGLDALARDLIARFEAADAGAADPLDLGLFTDAGAALDPAAESGLALRLSVNAVVDPAAGGELWRLRDGLGAGAPGDPGDTTMLRSLADALAAPIVPASGGFPGVARSLSGFAADILSRLGGERHSAETRASYAAARADSLHQMQLSDGVDTDAEIQKLLLIERAYAANARVLQVADEMIQTLLRI